ncbi:alpha-xenorhabdolysin family binary toxin subunit A [Pseudomonas fontis]|uniref:Alpha-xenorhabdolysin family binary toxin subunit A n=1 Tax=Pseudomonas fontis TaxID=2942633 RepID=A0ABT5NP23_9PSED|nr:alpha-xenorhabdolysin family binary toxin subunit A [Pseudomonas fontis]MDD0974365.1 alpha-xenorhabdolysin family binary toxin subunit A [Pseudomonas fontis]MDD0989907.1 alpha-xenorhabdolysin family binary toxin subunit A [Pseudomonas fontis]
MKVIEVGGLTMLASEMEVMAGQLSPEEMVEKVPEATLDMFAGRANNSLGEGLIFTRKHVVAIKSYIRRVQELPTTLEAFEHLDTEWVGFSLEHVGRVFDNLRTHIKAWDVLEDATKLLGIELTGFAGSFCEEGQSLIDIVKQTEAYKAGGKTLLEIWEHSATYTPMALGGRDAETVNSNIRYTLQLMRDDLAELKKRTADVRTRADEFGDAIKEKHLIEVGRLISQPQRNYPELMLDIRLQLDELDNKIRIKNKEYEDFLWLGLSGLAYLLIGGAITGGIYGPKAEVARKEKDILIVERNALSFKLEEFSPFVSLLEGIKSSFSELDTKLREVSVAVNYLEDMWRTIDTDLERSIKHLVAINSDVELFMFCRKMHKVVSPWEKIGDISGRLSELFNEMVEELDKEYSE